MVGAPIAASYLNQINTSTIKYALVRWAAILHHEMHVLSSLKNHLLQLQGDTLASHLLSAKLYHLHC